MRNDALTILYYMCLVVLYDWFCSSKTRLFLSLAFLGGLPVRSESILDYTRKRCLLHSRLDFLGLLFPLKTA